MDNGSISERFQGKFAELLEKEGKKVLQWLLFILVAVGSLLYFFVFKETKKNPHAALDATYFALTRSSSEEIPQELKAFETALNTNPTLAPNYQGKAAQLLLEKGAVDESILLLNPLLKRVNLDHFSEYKSFTENSLTISEGHLSQALTNALELQTALEERPVLFAHNLIRIAILQKLLDKPEFHETVQTIKNHLNQGTYSDTFSRVIESYNYKNLGLLSFFET